MISDECKVSQTSEDILNARFPLQHFKEEEWGASALSYIIQMSLFLLFWKNVCFISGENLLLCVHIVMVAESIHRELTLRAEA